MTLDIVQIGVGVDIGFQVTDVVRAGNIVSTQLGSIDYAPDFGVDLRYFLENPIQFQNESFRAYLVQRLSESQINVAEVIDTIEPLYEQYTFFLGDNRLNERGFIR